MAESMQSKQFALIKWVVVTVVTVVTGGTGYYCQQIGARVGAVEVKLDALKDTTVAGQNAQYADLRVQLATRPTAEEIAKIWKAIADSQRDLAVWSAQAKYNAEAVAKIQADMQLRK